MWRAAVFSKGRWSEARVVQREGVPPSPAEWLALARKADPEYPGLLRYFIEEAERADPNSIGREAIELWAERAAAENREFNRDSDGVIEAQKDTLSLIWRDKLDTGEAINPVSLAWHDRSMVMIALDGDEEELLLEYSPEKDETERAKTYWREFATPHHQPEMILDWRGYFGTECAIIDNWQQMRRYGHGYVTSLRGTAGYVTGMVLRRLTSHRGPLFKTDPTMKSRLAAMSNRFPEVARAVPDLTSLGKPAIKTSSAVVFVHGTLSCGLQGLSDLYPAAQLASQDRPRNVYRYEHDTFLSLADNARELAGLIESNLAADRLLIAAHSRGGLVARSVHQILKANNYAGDISVYTFGTPHLGTPLIQMGRGVLKALLSIGEHIGGAVPLASPLVKAVGYVYSPAELPPGIDVMDERSQARDLLNLLTSQYEVTAWGAKFSINGSPSGFGIATTGFLFGSLGPVPHDLVVPTTSALGYGRGQPVLNCSHTQYFADPTVRKAIHAFEPPLQPSGSLSRTAHSAAAQPLPIDNSRDDVVIIGGIVVPRHKI